jgi:hypothetical protein
MPEPGDADSHSRCQWLKSPCNSGRRDTGETPAKRKGRVVHVSRKNGQSRLRSIATGSDSESAVLLLVRQRLIEVGASAANFSVRSRKDMRVNKI